MTTFFYYRCSTEGQDETRQVEALNARVEQGNIFGDKITGVSNYGERPEYSKMVAMLQPDDLVITEDLTRYGRSMIPMLVRDQQVIREGHPDQNIRWKVRHNNYARRDRSINCWCNGLCSRNGTQEFKT